MTLTVGSCSARSKDAADHLHILGVSPNIKPSTRAISILVELHYVMEAILRHGHDAYLLKCMVLQGLGFPARSVMQLMQADIGVIGLAVMGQNLILNFADKGYKVCAYNRTVSKVHQFMENEAKGHPNVIGANSLEEFVNSLKPGPRRVMLMVKAGAAVDEFINHLSPLLSPGDIIIDGGNSHFDDTNRRCAELESKGLCFVGCGVSGGEEGARYGPSLMPGGTASAWPHLKDMFQAIAAKAEGEPCCDWVGAGGAGHYVKMVHNGIEYGDMQLIAESYHLMREALCLSPEKMSVIFGEWNKTELNSFLIEISRDILAYKDVSGKSVVESIRDVAGQKGTGKWTSVSALDLGVPVTLIAEAVFARGLSAHKEQRLEASKLLSGPAAKISYETADFTEHLRRGLYCAKLVSYAQGLMLLAEAAKEHGWSLNFSSIAKMWRGGCIIRSIFLNDIHRAFTKNPSLCNLLLDPFFVNSIQSYQASWRITVSEAIKLGIPMPAFSSALAFFDGFRTARLPANMIQAQRDYFGAHTFEYETQPGTFHHINWTGTGGNVTSSTYHA